MTNASAPRVYDCMIIDDQLCMATGSTKNTHQVVELSAFDAMKRERDEYVHEAEHFQNKCIDLDQANGILQQRYAKALVRIALLEELNCTDEDSQRYDKKEKISGSDNS